MLKFSAGATANPLNNRKEKADNLFTAAIETELEFVEEAEKAPSVLERIKGVFAKKAQSDDERFTDHEKSIELLAEQLKENGEKLTALSEAVAQRESEFATLKAENEKLSARLEEVGNQPAIQYTPRPLVAGEQPESDGRFF